MSPEAAYALQTLLMLHDDRRIFGAAFASGLATVGSAKFTADTAAELESLGYASLHQIQDATFAGITDAGLTEATQLASRR